MVRRRLNTGRPAKTAVILLLAAAAAGLALWIIRQGDGTVDGTDGRTPPPETDAPPTEAVVRLYFSDGENAALKPEDRVIRHSGSADALASAVVRQLIQGPETDLLATVPPSTRLNGVHLKEGIAYVDLSGGFVSDHPGGSVSELLTIYSIVNSIILNLQGLHAVKILVDGNETATLAGHMDLRRAFTANEQIIQ